MLINLTNHPFEKWEEKQKKEALQLYGVVADLPFPQIDPVWDEKTLTEKSNQYIKQCSELLHGSSDFNNAVHIMGEFTFTFAVVTGLIEKGIECIASTSERMVKEEGEGKKTIIFRFARFRKYN